MVRLLASGKITEEVWDGLWAEWQDRRRLLRHSLETLNTEQKCHIDNLETALELIAQIGFLYNKLERSDQKELLRQVIDQVIVNSAGKVQLKLRTPFAYLSELSDQARRMSSREGKTSQKKTGEIPLTCSPEPRSTGSNLAGEKGFEPSWIAANLSMHLNPMESPKSQDILARQILCLTMLEPRLCPHWIARLIVH